MEYLHSMLRVHNLTESLDFFCNKLGFIETRRHESQAGRFTLVFLAASKDKKALTENTPVIELTYNWDTEHYTSGRNFGHLAYRVDNIYELCQSLMDKGVTINRPPRDGYMAFIKSPDGVSIEFLQRDEPLPEQEPWKSMPNTGKW